VANTYDEVRAAYIAERPTYKELCAKSVELLEKGLREAGVRATIDSRVKDVVSFLGKVLREPDYLNGTKPVDDKAGIRIVLPYFDDEPAVRKVIESLFDVLEREETVDRLGADRLGYLAVHYIARPKDGNLSEEQQTLFEVLKVEIQVGSMAQRAWAEVSHDLLYKASLNLPVAYKRIANRLIALVELFDSEVGRVRERIAALPGFEVAPLLDALDRELLRFSGRQPDRVLSQEMVPALAALYAEPPEEIYPQRIQKWIESKRERLAELYDRYEEAEADVNPLFFQPEALLIFERAENDPTGLAAAWPATLPPELLVSLSELWGFPLEGGEL
jgi:ppGpp synthetase/RelA/SpoT-type nucleotidyltranferase